MVGATPSSIGTGCGDGQGAVIYPFPEVLATPDPRASRGAARQGRGNPAAGGMGA
jgi:hypothetical protein